jgi:hypothetical protein
VTAPTFLGEGGNVVRRATVGSSTRRQWRKGTRAARIEAKGGRMGGEVGASTGCMGELRWGSVTTVRERRSRVTDG